MNATKLDLPPPAGRWDADFFLNWAGSNMPYKQWKDAADLVLERELSRDALDRERGRLRRYYSDIIIADNTDWQGRADAAAKEASDMDCENKQAAHVLHIDRCMLGAARAEADRMSTAHRSLASSQESFRDQAHVYVYEITRRIEEEVDARRIATARVRDLRHAIAAEREEMRLQGLVACRYEQIRVASEDMARLAYANRSVISKALHDERQCLWAAEAIVLKAKVEECFKHEQVYADLQARGLLSAEHKALQVKNVERLRELQGLEARCFVKIRSDASGDSRQMRAAKAFRRFEQLEPCS